jgi:hypothetical protein
MALTSADRIIKPEELAAKEKKGQKIKGSSNVRHGVRVFCAAHCLKALCVICGVTLVCHMWCDTGVSYVV